MWGTVPDWISALAASAAAAIAFWQLKGIRQQIEESRKAGQSQLDGIRTQIQQAREQAESARNAAKIERTLAVCSRYESDLTIERCVRRLRRPFDDLSLFANPGSFKHELVMVLNYLDTIALGIHQNLYDESLARDHIGPIVLDYGRLLNLETFSRLGKNLDDYHCLTRLVQRWRERELAFKDRP